MKLITSGLFVFAALAAMPCRGQSQTPRASQPQLRPIGSSLRGLPTTGVLRETSSRIQQAAFLQFGLPENQDASIPGGSAPTATPVPSQFGTGTTPFSDGVTNASPMPSAPLSAPPTTTNPPATNPPTSNRPLATTTTVPTQTPPPGASTALPRTLPPIPTTGLSAAPANANSDLAPMSRPKLLGADYATVYNCANVSPASPYAAGRGYGCGVSPASATAAIPYSPPPAQIAAPAVMPPAVTLPSTTVPPVGTLPTNPASVTGAPAGSLVTFGQETFPVQVGQGLWGQPVAYVPGQSIRNWLRYLSF